MTEPSFELYLQYVKEYSAINRKIASLNKEIDNKLNVMYNIAEVIDLYNILQPHIKEKYVITKIIEMKYDLEVVTLRNEIASLRQLEEVANQHSEFHSNF